MCYLKLSQAPISGSGEDSWADAGWRSGGGGKAFPQTGSQMPLNLLNNQVIFFYNIQVNTSLMKLTTGTFSFLLLTTELVVLWLGIRSQVWAHGNAISGSGSVVTAGIYGAFVVSVLCAPMHYVHFLIQSLQQSEESHYHSHFTETETEAQRG